MNNEIWDMKYDLLRKKLNYDRLSLEYFDFWDSEIKNIKNTLL